MLETSIDGVPVFFAEGPPPFTAGLVFGVGRRDETFVSGGVTHLVEHLAMRAVGRTTIESNASVDLTATEFVASGSPDRVVAFLRAVCLALADLSTEQLAVEADVLRAEGGTVAAPPVALLLGELFGASGAGLAGAREPALRSLDAATVRDWAGRYFVRGNAALWLSGPVPEGLELPLADGPAPRGRRSTGGRWRFPPGAICRSTSTSHSARSCRPTRRSAPRSASSARGWRTSCATDVASRTPCRPTSWRSTRSRACS
ncbi:hypothetical protein [Blastococcus brunescens]|uniref:Insulinase family protein n=1 Tax=Blastococcus brunescens TaxID=1564165 RepID=A0ABZ1AWZ7_9ACTN|nr:hypothetical protein [Blastococcus sp. BMG 8361]WRL62642.1 hypothetical protein U6N30_22225 [Blastococcus sp. BMG 8361]